MVRRRFSNLDTLMLRMESPTNPVAVTGLLVLGAPIGLEQLKATLATRLLGFERFRQRVVPARQPWRTPYWGDDHDLDLDHHVQRVTLPPPGDQAALQRVVSELAGAAFDMARPPWQVHLVERYGAGCALICRTHHSLADGVSLAYLLAALADADAPASQPATGQPDSLRGHDGARGLRDRIGRRPGIRLMRRGLHTVGRLRRVTALPGLARDAAAVVGDIVLSPSDTHTPLRGAPSLPKKIAWSEPVPLEEVKTIGRQMGGTVNDVLLTALTGALLRYVEIRQDLQDDATLRVIIPINRRRAGAETGLGNQFTAVFLPLPVDIAAPAERLAEVRRRMDELKNSLQPGLVLGALEVVSRVPSSAVTWVLGFMSSKATAIVTNVKGPQERLYLGGIPVEAMMAWIPRYGGIGVAISILSYAGQVRLGVISDQSIVPDPENLIAGFHDEVAALLALAREVKRPLSIREASDLLDRALATLNQLVPDNAE